MNIQNEFAFSVEEDRVILKSNKSVYFYRITPPNLSIMQSDEKNTVIARFQSLLNSVDRRCRFSIFALDKFENLNENRRYIENMQCNVKAEFMREQLLELIDSASLKGKSVHRAFYFIICADTLDEAVDFETQLNVNGFVVHRANRREIANLLRNYYLHEYVDFDTDAFDESIGLTYSKYAGREMREYIGKALTKRLTPRRITFQSTQIQQSDFYRRVILVKSFPFKIAVKCMLSRLFKIKGTSVSMQLWQMPQYELDKMVRRQLQSKTSYMLDNDQARAIKAGEEMNTIAAFYQSLAADSDRMYYVNIFIEMTAHDMTELRELQADVLSELMLCGITAEQLSFEQKEGFFAMNPLHTKTYFSESANNLPSSAISWLYPFTYSSHNDSHGIPLGNTIDGGDMFIDFLKRDEFITNGHFIITGETGYGKSHLLKKIISMLYFCNVGVFCLSPNNEYSHMFKTLGGTVIDCAQGKVKINPFDIRKLVDSEDEASDLESFRQDAAYWQHLSWLKDFYSILFPKITREEIDSLGFYAKRAYAVCGINESSDISRLTAKDFPTFSNLYSEIEKSYESAENCLVPMEVRKSLLLLLDDVANGSLSYLFNGHTNIENADFIVFELQSLLAGSKDRSQAMIFNIMSWIWNRITAREKFYLFAIDELYMLVNKHNPIIVRYCNEFIKQFRKFKGLMGMATQQVNDVLDTQIVHETSSLFNAPAHKFLLNPGQLDIHEMIKILQLTSGENECMKNLRRGECLYKRSNETSYHVRIDKLPYESELFGKGGDG